MAPIKVYGMHMSAPFRIVTMTAEVLDVEYTVVKTNPMEGETRTPEFLAINPQHSIPTMVDGDYVLNESRAIATYLVNKYGKDKMNPQDPETKGRVDQRLYFDMGVLYKAAGEVVYTVMFSGVKPAEDKVEKLHEALSWLDSFVKDDQFMAGNMFTVADISLLATYSTIKATGMDLSKYSHAEAWFARVSALIPNYEKANGEGAAMFGAFYQSKLPA